MLSRTGKNSRDTKDSMPVEIAELLEQVAVLPDHYQRQLDSSITRVIEMTRRRRRILTLVQDALGQLRLDMKYLMFDLDATRRERDELRDSQDGEY